MFAFRIFRCIFSKSIMVTTSALFFKPSLFVIATMCQAAKEHKDDDHWGHAHLVKQASVGVVNSSTTLLTIVTASMIDAQESYIQVMETMLSLIEAKIIGSILHDDICQHIIELRAEMEEKKHTWQAIEMQMASLSNVMNTAAEMAFSVGAQYIGITANERLSSAQQQFNLYKEKIRQLELEVKLAQVKDISNDRELNKNES